MNLARFFGEAFSRTPADNWLRAELFHESLMKNGIITDGKEEIFAQKTIFTGTEADIGRVPPVSESLF